MSADSLSTRNVLQVPNETAILFRQEYLPFDSKKKREYLPFSLTELTSALAVSTDRARMYVLRANFRLPPNPELPVKGSKVRSASYLDLTKKSEMDTCFLAYYPIQSNEICRQSTGTQDQTDRWRQLKSGFSRHNPALSSKSLYVSNGKGFSKNSNIYLYISAKYVDNRSRVKVSEK